MPLRLPDSACTPKGQQPIEDPNTPNPLNRDKSSKLDSFFHDETPIRWLPEIYAADNGGDTKGFIEGLRIMSGWRHFPLKSSTNALLQYCESDHGKKQLALLASFYAFRVVSDHLAVNAGSCSADSLKDNLQPLDVNSGGGSPSIRKADSDRDIQDTSRRKKIRTKAIGLGASSSITATTSAFYDPKSPFLDTSMPASSPKGTPTEAESDDVQAQSDTRARKRGRLDSGPTKDPESYDNSGEASTRSEKPVQEPEFP
ncbi:hypothetical protein BGX34_004892, partial [Mortierella sp. NVP85]